MNILCTFPGRHGDLLWALPTVRAISQRIGEPIDLCVSPTYRSLVPLIQAQSYIHRVIVPPAWRVIESAPMTPREPPPVDAGLDQRDYDRVFHLGYQGWPEHSLPYETEACLHAQWKEADGPAPRIDLHTPWVVPPYRQTDQVDLAIGFTDEHFEIKYGIYWLLRNRFCYGPPMPAQAKSVVVVGNSPRWNTEAGQYAYDWTSAAAWIAASKCFVGCCSALHVLAVAIGTPVVCVEPNPNRHQGVFWPCEGDQVWKVLGGDGLWTVDARHVGEAIEAVWARVSPVRPGAD